MTTQQLILYYQSLLIVQYASLPNATGTVAALMNRLIQNQIISAVNQGFDVDTALGAQLDIMGSYRGVNREAFGVVPGNYWSLPSVNDTLPGTFNGWASVSDPNANMLTIRWLQVNDLNSLSYSLTDIQMRLLIQLKAQIDAWDGTLGGLDTIMFNFFGTYVNVVDAGNMTLVYQHNHLDTDPNTLWLIAVTENVLPHPAGVQVSTVEI
jgi:hypothetical protein